MSGRREVKVLVTGDAQSLQRSLKTSGDQLDKFGTHGSKSLNKLGGGISSLGNKMGGEFGSLLAETGEGIERMGEKGSRAGSKLMAAGGALTGLGVALQAVGSKDKAALAQLDAAVTASGHSFSEYKEEVEKTVKSEEKYAHKAPDTLEALRRLTQATGDPKKALEEMSVVTDLAAAKHESLSEAAGQLAKVHGGAGRVLKEFGINMGNAKAAAAGLVSAEHQHASAVEKLSRARQRLSDLEAISAGRSKLSVAQQIQLRNAHAAVTAAQENLANKTTNLAAAQEQQKHASNAAGEAIEQLGAKVKGQGAASVDNFSGKLDILKTKLEDGAAAFGVKFGGAVTAAGPVVFGFGAIVQSGMIGKLGKASKAIGTTIKDGASLGKSLFIVGQSFAKTGLIAVGQALKTGGAWLVTNGVMLATSVAQKAMAAAQWLLNAALDANPIGLIIIALIALGAGLVMLWKHSETFRRIVTGAFHFVLHAITATWGWIKGHWPLLLSILTGPIGAAVIFVVRHWDGIVSFFTKLPGRIGKAAHGMWDGIKDAFKAMLNWIIDGWNGLEFKMPSVDTHIPGVGKIGGWTLGLPNIPRLKHGGVTTGPTLALIGDNPGGRELVQPLPPGAGYGALGGDDGGEVLEVNLYLDGQKIQTSLLKLKRKRGGGPLGIA